MKKILSLMVLLMPMLACAQNYFAPGTVWKAKNMTLPYDPREVTYTLVETLIENNEQAMALQSESESTKTTLRYIRTEGEKVFWRSTDPDFPTWYLMYDFGLKAGEETVIYYPWNNGEVIANKVTCIDPEYFDEDIKTTVMLLEGYKEGDNPEFSEQAKWIKGMGNLYNMIMSVSFGVEGTMIDVYEILHDGEVLYSSPALASIQTIKDSNADANAHAVYDLSGRFVGSNVKTLSPGLYLQVSPEKVEKIRVR